MHELSIAHSMLEIILDHAQRSQAKRVIAVTVRIGALSCVHPEPLRFGLEMISQGTIAEGANLNVQSIPLTLFCHHCQTEVELPGIQDFCCPVCQRPGSDIRHGQELDIESIEIMT